MNLMTQAIENIYKYGNTTLHLGRHNCKIIFAVGSDRKLNIREEHDYGDFVDSYDFSVEEGVSIISYLVYYSVVNSARKNDNVYLTSDIKEKKSELTIEAVNELYHQLIPLIAIKKRNMETLAKCNWDYPYFANLSVYVDNNLEILSIKEILKTLLKKYEQFENTLVKAYKLWEEVRKENWKESSVKFNNWKEFLNQLYIYEFDNNSTVDLSTLNVDYEFLTNKQYLLNPAVNREEEIEELEIALLMPNKSAILVGAPGVGKTAVVEGLAYRINNGQVPPVLQNKQILKINTSSIVRGCCYVGMFEEKVEKLMKYLLQNPDTILFIDEIHTAIGAGLGSKGNLDLANIMKPYMDRGQVKVIGSTTEEEYEKYIKNDRAFNRRFQKISISEPQKSAIFQILEKNIIKLEKVTGVKWEFNLNISKMIIEHIVECTNEKRRVYDDKRYNPDISLTILENSFARALLKGIDSITINNISDAISKSEFLYESVRMESAQQLMSKYQAIMGINKPNQIRRKIIKFPVQKI